jgi:DNA recombination-dependent growth factor C
VGARRGTLSFSRFFVQGAPPKGFRNKFVEAIRLRAFTPLQPEDEADHTSGWCVIEKVFDLELTHDKIYREPYLLLGFRTDRWRVPSALLRARMAEEEEKLLARTGREKLSRKEKTELKQRLVTRLRTKVLPVSRAVDVCWDLDNGVVRFWNQARRTKDDFAALFEKTFRLELVEESPYTTAVRAGLSERELEALGSAELTLLSRGAVSSLRQARGQG